jgi:Fe-S cluster assembly protein SufD
MTDSSEIHLARESVLRWTDVVEGYRAFRGELLVRHLGEGSESILEAISLTDGNDHQAHHWRVEHKVPNTSSRQWWVGLASGKAQSHFAGKVFVEKGASRTDARQHSRGVVLSPGSRVHARPQLEIFNDDVKCAHGSAVGPMDEEALFYLRSRGIDETRARQMILASLVRERSQALTRDLGGLEVWARERIEACLARLSGGAR